MPTLAELKRRVEQLEGQLAKLMIERGISPIHSPWVKELVEKAAPSSESNTTKSIKRRRGTKSIRPKTSRTTRKNKKKK